MWSIETMRKLNAEEVRRRAERARKRPAEVSGLVAHVDGMIKAAADKGEMELTKNPLAGLRQIISPEEARAVWTEFRGRGFKVVVTARKFRLSW